ncbi:MAG TPA: hypothetical protein VLC09_19175 [Polyangiaceae bacterium]|nr:hypothetical protein [Polyangiaceae bacterium]
MSPRLRARVLRSVQGQSRLERRGATAANPVRRTTPSTIAALRVGALLALLALALFSRRAWTERKDELARARAQLLGEVKRASSALDARFSERRATAERFLDQAAREHPASEKSLDPAALRALLEGPLLYLRGPIEAMQTSEGRSQAMLDTRNDALLGCLLKPPAAIEDRATLDAVRAVYRGDHLPAERTERISGLLDFEIAETYLGPAFRERIAAAADIGAVRQLSMTFTKARPASHARATHSATLLYALDEPKSPGSLSEIDGASDHFIRVGVVDLDAAELRFARRVHSQPERTPADKKLRYARGFSECAAVLELSAAGR